MTVSSAYIPLQLGQIPIARQNAKARYRAYVEAGVDADIASFYAGARQSPILGDDVFKRTLGIDRRAIDLPELSHARSAPNGGSLRRLVNTIKLDLTP